MLLTNWSIAGNWLRELRQAEERSPGIGRAHRRRCRPRIGGFVALGPQLRPFGNSLT